MVTNSQLSNLVTISTLDVLGIILVFNSTEKTIVNHLYLLSLRYTIFATHMENLSELGTIYPNVKILHFNVDIRNNRLDFKVVYLTFF